MKRLAGWQSTKLAGLLGSLLIVAFFLLSATRTDKDLRTVEKISQRMKTVCVGRYLIDLPAEASVTIGRGLVGGYEVWSTANETDQEFAARLRRTEVELTEQPGEDGRSTLESAKLLAIGNGHGKTFVYNRQRTKVPEGDSLTISETISMRSLIRLPGVSVTANVDWLDPDETGDIERLLAQIAPIESGQLPREQGFCLGHALVRDPYDHIGTESLVAFAGLPGHADVNVAFSSMSGTASAPGLLARNAKAAARDPVLMRLAFTTIREGARAINGIHGEELVLRVREPNLTTGYSFQWESRGKPKDIHAPLLTLELDSGTNPATGGKPVQSSLSEEALIALWERIAGSIQIRPAHDAPAAAPRPVIEMRKKSALTDQASLPTCGRQCASSSLPS